MNGDRRETCEYPTARLAPTSRRLVAAARRLLARGGYESLTVEAVAAEAGVYRDAVRYHFGSKAAFVAAVVDSLSHDQSLNAVAETQAQEPGERVRGLSLIHISEPTRLLSISYAVFCLTKKKTKQHTATIKVDAREKHTSTELKIKLKRRQDSQTRRDN